MYILEVILLIRLTKECVTRVTTHVCYLKRSYEYQKCIVYLIHQENCSLLILNKQIDRLSRKTYLVLIEFHQIALNFFLNGGSISFASVFEETSTEGLFLLIYLLLYHIHFFQFRSHTI